MIPIPDKTAPNFWRHFWLQMVLLCFLGFYSLGSVPHQHEGLTGDLDCPSCHVAGHSALDVPIHEVGVPGPDILFLLLSGPLVAAIPYVLRRYQLPPLRGPPSLSRTPF